jgi:hypothetical protein
MNTNMSPKKADRAVEMTRASAHFLAPGWQTWGLLESIGPGPDDLITVRVQGKDHLVGAEILPKIEGHVGEQVTVWNIEGQFHAGVLSPCPQ